jgi:hypothetical protein
VLGVVSFAAPPLSFPHRCKHGDLAEGEAPSVKKLIPDPRALIPATPS